MRGEPLIPVACPEGCGMVIGQNGRSISLLRRTSVTTRHRVRRALDSHFTTHHPGLSVRQRSLLADRVVQELGL